MRPTFIETPHTTLILMKFNLSYFALGLIIVDVYKELVWDIYEFNFPVTSYL